MEPVPGAPEWRQDVAGGVSRRASSFHGKVPDEFLDRGELESEPQDGALGAPWKEEYNTERPLSSPGYEAPSEFSATCGRPEPVDEDLPDPSSTRSTST